MFITFSMKLPRKRKKSPTAAAVIVARLMILHRSSFGESSV
jgi:hypothetical protein